MRASVVGVLAARGVVLSAFVRGSLDACRDSRTMERWLAQAAVAISAADALR